MCGVFGMQYNLEVKGVLSPGERAVVALLLAEEIQSRGRDASGYALWDAEKQQVFYDKSIKPYAQCSTLIAAITNATNILCHTRYATVGAKTYENAHPWHIGDIIGAHNGGIFNYKDMAEKYKARAAYEVDSMHLIAHINEGLDTEELEGYGTVEWYDLRDPGAVYLCVMNRGDLEIERLPDDSGVVWASTRSALSKALGMIGMYSKSKQLQPEEGRVYRVFNGTIERTERTMKLKAATWTNRSTGKQVTHTSTGTKTTYGPFGSNPLVTNGYRAPTAEVVQGISGFKYDPNQVAYNQAVREYNREVANVFNMDVDMAMMTRRQRRRFERLLVEVENHEAHCNCVKCLEIFRLAASGT